MKASEELYIGLMSGTSLDGVDAVLVQIDADGHPTLIGKTHQAFCVDFRQRLLALNSSGPDELHRASLAANELADTYASAVLQLLQNNQKKSHEITAIGAHGQTIRHRPDLGYTIQLNSPARLAEHCAIDVIADFRSRDVAAGGQGAPLVPVFHQQVFGGSNTRVILNLGGIANVTILTDEGSVLGFDTGPANMLMDAWCEKHTGNPYDDQGHWGASGRMNPTLLNRLLDSQPWFDLMPPKSTGRDMFHLSWLESELNRLTHSISAADVQATLQQLTATTVLSALKRAGVTNPDIFVCGGGAQNSVLMSLLRTLGANSVQPTDSLGVPAQDVEAIAFAWLAWAYVHKKTGNLTQVTGARAARKIGALWPA